MNYRGAYQIGATVDFRSVFTDVAGDFISADAVPVVYFYDESVEDEVREAEVAARTFTSAIATVNSTALGTGYYSAEWEIDTDEGLVYEYWDAEIDGAAQTTLFTWTATAGAEVRLQTPGPNTMVIIEINGITSDTGEVLEERLFFTTKYVPLYASPDLLRLELGQLVASIPDDTLALMLHRSSKEADFIQSQVGCNIDRLKHARTKFVLYDAALHALIMHVQSNSIRSGGSKRLGDLSVSLGSSDSSSMNISADDLLPVIKAERDKWFKVMQAGGCLNPGQGFAPVSAVKGRYDPDRRLSGRLWEDPREFAYANPSVNEKRRRNGRLRGRWGLYPVAIRGSSDGRDDETS
jgi:hypothetical protein